MTRQLIVDTETTGLYAQNGDRLIELAALEIVDRVVTGNHLHLYFNPERDIHEEATKVHGLSWADLRDKPKFAEKAQEIADYLRGAEFIAHNAPFDVGFINMEFQRAGLPPLEEICTITDTLIMAKERYPGQRLSLDALCTRLGIDRSKRVFHGALIDCELLADVYLEMTREQFSLDIGLYPTHKTHRSGSLKTQRPKNIKIIRATEEELVAHRAYLQQLKNPIFLADSSV